MIIKFKLAEDNELHTIEGENLTLIKVALLVKYGFGSAIHIFQKQLKDSLLLYCPNKGDRDNLVKRSFTNYVEESSIDIAETIETIKQK